MPVDIRKLANVLAGADVVGAANMGGSGYGGGSQGPPMPGPQPGGTGTIQAGAANVPGMSIHCLKCGHKIKRGLQECPKCGNDVSRVAEDDANTDNSQSNGTGGEEAVSDAKAQGDYEDEGKYASAATLRGITPLARNLLGGAAATTGLYVAGKYTLPMHRAMKEDARKAEQEYLDPRDPYAYTRKGGQQLRRAIRKAASARPGNPIYNIRKGNPSSVEEGLEQADSRVASLKAALARKGY